KMLNRTGFGHLTPIRSGSWHFRTSLFTESDLTVILPAIFDEYSESIEAEEPDESGALYGGMALCDENGGVLIEPTCCADLRNINSWNEAADYRKSTWQQVWIGHPWVSVKYEEPRLVFSDLHEHQDPVARWSICPEDLRFAIDQAEKELFQFSDKIGNSLRNIEYDGDVNVLSKNLAGVGDLRIS
ncbi:MAG: hypothetical protein KDA65_15625, partial [Planctomycetaceae bacterium]|nr:hypothetical protein [Planctomycetaceae bacterium]